MSLIGSPQDSMFSSTFQSFPGVSSPFVDVSELMYGSCLCIIVEQEVRQLIMQSGDRIWASVYIYICIYFSVHCKKVFNPRVVTPVSASKVSVSSHYSHRLYSSYSLIELVSAMTRIQKQFLSIVPTLQFHLA